MDLDLLIEDPCWEAHDLPALCAALFPALCARLALDPEATSLTLMACDDSRIAALNADFRDKPRATNVLSWPSEERGAVEEGALPTPPQPDPFGEIALGDIALAYETCLREAEEQGKPAAHHLTHLILHGTLHLLGYDHERPGDAALMEGLEVDVLAELGLPDPYVVG